MADEDGVKIDTDAPDIDTPAADAPAETPKSLVTDDQTKQEPGAEPGKAGQDQPAAEPEKPIEYTDFTLPEGWEPMQASLGEFKTLAAEAKLPQAQAQKFVDLLVKRDQELARQTEAQAGKWAAELQALPNSAELLADAKRAYRICEPEMQAMLQQPAIGNNPAIVKSMAKIGRMLKEHGFVDSASRLTGERRAEDVIFGEMFKKP